ncbi:MAG TPA: long-chain fatty acid--CoA ligase [Candidatus Limnocylindrales bacterium]|nr:long-chain fatty acid--CoA ligase [Candidatus Limnocylindrales bacterium]
MEKPWLAHYPEDVLQTISYPEESLYQILHRSAQKYPDHPAIIFFGNRITYRELLEQVDRLATALHKQGVQKQDRIALFLPNCPQSVIAYYAALRLGAIVVQVNPLYVERELKYQLEDAGVEVLIALDLLYPKIRNIRETVPLRQVILTSIKDYLPFPLNRLYTLKQFKDRNRVKIRKEEEVLYLTELIREHPSAPPNIEVKPQDIALLQYTGGTTGTSKGVILTHRNLVVNAVQCRNGLPKLRDGEETVLAVLPFFHVFGMTVAMNLAIYAGFSMILLPRFEVVRVLKAIDKYKPTFFPGVPTMYVAINNYPKLHRYDLSSLKFCLSGAAPLPLEVMERFEAITGSRIVEGYGLTEASPVTHCNPVWGLRKPGSIGFPFPDTEAKVVDPDTGADLPVGEIGELVIRGPQVMQGYWHRDQETESTLKEGWLFTGDLAKMDEDGYFYIIDRKKDLIIASGFNVYPREVEEVLYEHPKILEAAVIGIPDPYRGETVKAFVVLKKDQKATEEEILDFCRKNLAAYKVPTQIEFKDQLPKTLVGKVLRRMLREG